MEREREREREREKERERKREKSALSNLQIAVWISQQQATWWNGISA
jgi:hypothetical protein